MIQYNILVSLAYFGMYDIGIRCFVDSSTFECMLYNFGKQPFYTRQSIYFHEVGLAIFLKLKLWDNEIRD